MSVFTFKWHALTLGNRMFTFEFFVEAFGYLASLIVVFSLTRTSVKKLWIINGIGAIAFIVYACIIHSYPTALMNLGALVIDVVQLWRLYHVQNSFELVKADRNSEYFKWFINKHAEDLKKFSFNDAYQKAEHLLYFVRNNEIAGLLGYNQKDDNADIVVDYVTDKFRDRRIGRYFFGKEHEYFRSQGINAFTANTTNPAHENYLRQLHFLHVSGNQWAKSY
ncbi:MAG: YgjV family protein [Proteobacteria bacterium]|nr:YgjV family protein [Pseudomonadota bacterium]